MIVSMVVSMVVSVIVSVIQLYSFLNLLNILGAHCSTLTVKLMNVWNQPTGVSRWAAGQRLGARGAAVKGGAGSQAERQGHNQPGSHSSIAQVIGGRPGK